MRRDQTKTELWLGRKGRGPGVLGLLQAGAALLLAGVLLLNLAGCLPQPQPGPWETGPGTGPSGSLEPDLDPTPTPAQTPSGAAVLPPDPTPTPEPEVFRLAYDPSGSLDPIDSTNEVNRDLIGLVYQGLYTVDSSFHAEAALAGWSQVSWDGLTWTFTLREGAAFSDGSPVTLRHVVQSLNRARNSTVYAGRFANINGIRAGEDVLEISLAAPDGNLPCLLDIPITTDRGGAAPLGTGYYSFLEDEEGNLSLERNLMHDSYQALPYESIPLVPVDSPAARMEAFHRGEVSLVPADLTGMGSLGYAGGQERTEYATSDLLYAGFQCSKGPCADALVRRAVSKILDRDAVVSQLMNGVGEPVAIPVSPASDWWDGDANARMDTDPDAAAVLLDQAGYTINEEDGLRYHRKTALSFKIIINGGNELRNQIAKLLKQELEAVGAQAEIQVLTWNQYVAALEAGDFDIWLGEVILPANFDFSSLTSGSLNYGGFEQTSDGKLSSKAVLEPLFYQWRGYRGTAKEEAAQAMWTEFESLMPFAPICFRTGTLLIRWGMAANVQPAQSSLYYHMEEWQTQRS